MFPDLPNLHSCPHVAFLPQGGSNLRHWLEKDHLKDLNKNECCIYDREDDARYEGAVAAVNAKGPGHYARLTGSRTIENYLHPDAITEAYAEIGITIAVSFGQNDDVPSLGAELVHSQSGSGTTWADLSEKIRKQKISRVKARLNEDAVKRMTAARLQESDPNKDLIGWFEKLKDLIGLDHGAAGTHA